MLGDLLMSFFEVARQGSVTAAAKRLRLSQPTVTGRIRQLEETYGVELFHRRGSRLDLSDLGVSLMPIVERLAQQEGDVDFLLRNAGDLRTGNLRVGATGPYYILPSVAAFRSRHPTVEITIELGNSQQMLEALMPGVRVRTYETTDAIALDLVAGRIDALLVDRSALKAIVEAEGGQGRNIQAFGPAFTRGVLGTGVGVGLRKQDQDLKRAFETAIGEATRDGTIARISTQWFGYDISIRN